MRRERGRRRRVGREREGGGSRRRRMGRERGEEDGERGEKGVG